MTHYTLRPSMCMNFMKEKHNMNEKLFIRCIDDLVKEINNLNTTLKGIKEDIHYITEMVEDEMYGVR